MGQLNFGPVVKTVAGGMTYCSYLGMFLQAVEAMSNTVHIKMDEHSAPMLVTYT